MFLYELIPVDDDNDCGIMHSLLLLQRHLFWSEPQADSAEAAVDDIRGSQVC